MLRSRIGWLMLVAGVLIAGCEGKGTDPASPAATPEPTASPAIPQVSPAFVPTLLSEGQVAGFGTFGTLGGTLDLATLEIALDPPARQAALGETFDLDITDFTSENPCVDCLRIEGVGLNAEGQILVDVSLRHPFKLPAFFFSRPDLNVFDTRVIAILPGTDASNTILTYPDNAAAPTTTSGNFGAVVNQDGMTSHFDSRAEDPRYFDPPKGIAGNINAYKRYFEDPVEVIPFEPTNPDGWNVMPIASPIEVQTFILDPAALGGTGAIPFVLVAEAAWGVARSLAIPEDEPGGRFNPKYWLPEFNQHEPWKVDVAVQTNTLTAGIGTSAITFQVGVSDWQAGRSIDPNYPDLNNLQGLAVASDVARVRAAIPGVNNAGSFQTAPTSGSGTATDPYLYNFSLMNAEGAPAGDYFGLVAAEDNLNGSSAGPQRVPELGFPRQGAEILNYVGYRAFPVHVREFNFPPQVTVEFQPTNGILEMGGQACFQAEVTDLNLGDTHTIEWDFSYDASAGFMSEATGSDVCRIYPNPGIFTVAVRVTDSGTPPQEAFEDSVAVIRVNGSGQAVRLFDAGRFDKTPSDGGQSAFGFQASGAGILIFSGQGNGEDVFVSRTLNGVSWTVPGNLSLMAAGDQTRPDLAVSGNAVFIAWEDNGTIRGAISTDGTNYTAGITIAANGTLPAVAATSPTIFYVAYSNGGDVFIEANATGNLADFTMDGTRVNDEIPGLQTRPDLAADPNEDRVFIAWEDSRDPEFGVDIYGAIATARATMISPNRVISDDRSMTDDTEPAVCVAQNGDWFGVAYVTKRYRATGDIIVTHSVNQGVAFQPGVVLTVGPLATYSSPSIAVRNDLSATLVGWTRVTGGTDFGVRHAISNDGAKSFKATVDPGAMANANPNPSVALQPQVGDNTIVVWTDQSQAGTGEFGQIFMRIGFEHR